MRSEMQRETWRGEREVKSVMVIHKMKKEKDTNKAKNCGSQIDRGEVTKGERTKGRKASFFVL